MGAFILFLFLVALPLFLALRALKRSKVNPYIKEHEKRSENREKYVAYLNWLRENSPEEIPLPEVLDETEIERRFENREREGFFRRVFK